MSPPFGVGFGTLLFSLIFAPGCTNWLKGRSQTDKTFLRTFGSRPAVLTKDDAILVDQTRLTISGLVELKNAFSGLSREQTLWAITACVAVQNHGKAKQIAFSPSAAIQIVNFALGRVEPHTAKPALEAAQMGSEYVAEPNPDKIKAWLNSILARAVIQKNVQVLAELL